MRQKRRFVKKEIARINERIRAGEVRLISEEGEQLGVKKTSEAIIMAKDEGLDLVEIAPNAKPPVARIMDYGKYRYEKEQQAKKAKKKQHIVEVKEIKFRPKIGSGDYETKKRHVERFLKSGAKVKITIMFRGREMTHPELGRGILDRLIDDVAEFSEVEVAPKREGRNMLMILTSTVKKQTIEASMKKEEEAIEQEDIKNEDEQTQEESK